MIEVRPRSRWISRRLISGTGGACALALLLGSHSVAAQTSPEENPREAALAQSRALVALGEYAAALPHAETYLALSEAAGGSAGDLARAHLELSSVHLGLGNHASAEQSVGAAITLIEATSGIVSRKLVEPLTLLGDVYLAQERYADAARVLTQAIEVTRRTDGLFTLKQLPLIESLVEAQTAAGDEQGVERELRFAILATKQELGTQDVKTLEAVRRLAGWYEYVEQYDRARFRYGQIVETYAAAGDIDLAPQILVGALLGITRSHRLQYAHDPRSLEATAATVDPITGRTSPLLATQQRVAAIKPEAGGEKAALKALEVLESRPAPPRELLFETLVELGDWYITNRKPETAAPYYNRAWNLLDEEDERLEVLRQPRVLVYRSPSAVARSQRKWEGTIPPREIDFSLTVGSDGRTADVVAVTPDAPPGHVGQIRRALEVALFSPRIDAGKPVATPEYHITEQWYAMDAGTTQQSSNGASGHRL